MIKAIIFDCFGVLTTDGWLPFKRKYFGHSKNFSEQATTMNRLVDAGLADYDTFIHDIALLANVPEDEARQDIENNVPNEELLSFISTQLKPHYKIGLLSNAGANWLNILFSANHLDLFDATALSFETGILKPQPEAYRIIAERLGVEPEECLFLDDNESYCAAAREVGMKAIWYESFEQAARQVTEVLTQA